MASKALEEINAKVTKLQDQLRQIDDQHAAATTAHQKKRADVVQELADWAELLDVYLGATQPKPAAKKAAAPKK